MDTNTTPAAPVSLPALPTLPCLLCRKPATPLDGVAVTGELRAVIHNACGAWLGSIPPYEAEES